MCFLATTSLPVPTNSDSVSVEESDNATTYTAISIIPLAPPSFSWHYVQCPPENECTNGHHTCSPKSEQCVDMDVGFECICGSGYKPEKYEVVQKKTK